MNGDPRKAEIAAAQVYFAISTRAHEMHQLRAAQEERLETRLKVSESFKLLAETAAGAGVLSENFGLFVDAGYMGLHHHTRDELKAKKGIPEKEDYLDNVGRAELSAIDFKNVQTDEKLRRDQVAEEDQAIATHHYVGDQVRKALEAINAPMPETLPPAPSIRKMVEERRRATKKGESEGGKAKSATFLAGRAEEHRGTIKGASTMSTIFFSHSMADVAIAESFKRELEQMNSKVYLFEHDRQPGRDVADKVKAQIERSDILFVLLTNRSQSSSYVHQEIGYAEKAGKPILPLIESGMDPRQLAMLVGRKCIPFDYSNADKSLSETQTYVHNHDMGKLARDMAIIAGIIILALIVAYYVNIKGTS